jgi:hypothetical protein
VAKAPKDFWKTVRQDDAELRLHAQRQAQAPTQDGFEAKHTWSWCEEGQLPTHAVWQAVHRPGLRNVIRVSRLVLTEPISTEALRSNPTGANAIQRLFVYSGFTERLVHPTLSVHTKAASIIPPGLRSQYEHTHLTDQEFETYDHHGLFDPKPEDYAAITFALAVGRLGLHEAQSGDTPE